MLHLVWQIILFKGYFFTVNYAYKTHSHNYAPANHNHPINYYLNSSLKAVTPIGKGISNATGYTGGASGKASGYTK